jgi:hypothetical protein
MVIYIAEAKRGRKYNIKKLWNNEDSKCNVCRNVGKHLTRLISQRRIIGTLNFSREKLRARNNKTGKVYSLEYTKITKVFFTPHYERWRQHDNQANDKCNNGIQGHCWKNVMWFVCNLFNDAFSEPQRRCRWQACCFCTIYTQSCFVCQSHLAAKQERHGWEAWPLNFAYEAFVSCS